MIALGRMHQFESIVLLVCEEGVIRRKDWVDNTCHAGDLVSGVNGLELRLTLYWLNRWLVECSFQVTMITL